MPLRTRDFDYHLPDGLIAARPLAERAASRMLVVHRDSGRIEHRMFREFPEFLRSDDLLVLNDTKVIPAGVFSDDGKTELLCLERLTTVDWRCLVRPGKRLKAGRVLTVGGIAGTVTDVTSSPNIANTGIVTYTVTGTLDDPDVDVLAGMSAVITFIKSEKDGVLLVPVKAVSLSTDGIQTVNVKKADGTIEKRTVETGLSNGVQTEVVSGLTEGETVVIGSVSK